MATMYALFFGVLLTAVCFTSCDCSGVLETHLKDDQYFKPYLFAPLSPAQGDKLCLDTKFDKTQGGIPLCDPFSKILNKIELVTLRHNFVFNGFCSKVSRSRNARPIYFGRAICSVGLRRDDLLGYGERGSDATVLISERIAGYKAFQCMAHEFSSTSNFLTFSKNVANVASARTGPQSTLMPAYAVAGCNMQVGRSIVASRYSDEFFAHFFAEKKCEPCRGSSGGREEGWGKKMVLIQNAKPSTDESIRNKIIHIAHGELGVREATGHNDGDRVEEYLRYTNLGSGYDWCAAFVSWCYGQAGLAQPRNPWSPALFPKARMYWKQGRLIHTKGAETGLRVGAALQSGASTIQRADIFGIYGRTAKRINHVGLVKEQQDKYLVTIEGNSNNRVESRRRHLSTVYAIADWVDQ